MRVSQQVLEWQEEARPEEAVQRMRRVVLRALELRYRGPVPEDVAAAVAGLGDVDELSRWFDATQTTDSVDAFRAAVALAPGG